MGAASHWKFPLGYFPLLYPYDFLPSRHPSAWETLKDLTPAWPTLAKTERLHFHFSLSCTGEGNGSHSSVLAWRIPGTGAWWTAIYGVTQSWTRLTCLSSGSSSSLLIPVNGSTPTNWPVVLLTAFITAVFFPTTPIRLAPFDCEWLSWFWNSFFALPNKIFLIPLWTLVQV